MLLEFILSNPVLVGWSVSVGLLISLVFQVVKFYANVRSLPPGPLPLPLLGNVLEFLKKGNRLPHQVMYDFRKKFGPIFTFWTGNVPQVIVTDPKITKDALTKVEFAGRPIFGELNDLFFGKGHTDIVFADFGREWEVMRKVAHSAVRKFAVNDRLPIIINNEVKKFLAEISEQNGDKPFDPQDYLTFLMMSVLATSAFGREFKMSDADFKGLSEANKLQVENNNRVFLITFVPQLKYIFREAYQNIKNVVGIQRDFATREYKEHVETYKDGIIRDFTDAMISAKREAEAEDSSDSKYLNEINVVNAVLDLFGAGSETTKITLQWILLFLANYPKYQKALREEVEEALGSDEMPTLEHRPQCNLLQAFISESMRIRPIVPTGLPHKAITDTELAGHKIQKGVSVLFSLEDCSMDKDIWGDPEVFRPERFLDENGKYNPKPNQYFAPLGGGRRICLGERLASSNSFLIMAGLLHQTRGKLISLPAGPGSVDLSPRSDSDLNVRPQSYKLVIQ